MVSKFITAPSWNFKPLMGLMLVALTCLYGCQTPQYRTVNREVLADIQTTLNDVSSANDASVNGRPPDDVLQALVPGLTLNSATQQQDVEERFDFAVQQPMDARQFFGLLTDGTPYGVVVHPGISGNIASLDLKNVTISEALDYVSALYGYQIKRTGNIFQVLPGGLQTRIYKVNYLNVNRSGSSNMQVVASGILNNSGANGGGLGGINGGFGGLGGLGGGFGGGLGGGLGGLGGVGGQNGLNGLGQGGFGGSANGGASIRTSSEADYWEDLEDILRSIIGAGTASGSADSSGLLNNLSGNGGALESRSVIVSPQTGMVVVRAYPDELDQVAEFLDLSQAALQRQVVLEAKILEVELKEGFQAGIDFSVLGKVNSTNSVAAELGFLGEALASDSSPLKLTYGSSDFNAVLTLLETQGNVQVVSSPRISTLNNQKAVFKVGDEEYFATNANTTTINNNNSGPTTNSNANLQPFFSGIALDVTPQISEDGDIILHIHPLLNEVQENNKQISGEMYPLANTKVRESDSIARARNGEVIIISGLMQTRARGKEAGIPGVRDIPVIGNAAEQKQRETVKIELVILLRAIVDEGSNMQNLIDDHTAGFDKLSRQIDPYYRQ